MRDSNPRMLGPEPSALPLGESPTDSANYSDAIGQKVFSRALRPYNQYHASWSNI